MISPETEYNMIRAMDEAVLAIRSPHPAAAASHYGLVVRYSTLAIRQLAEGDGNGSLPSDTASSPVRPRAWSLV